MDILISTLEKAVVDGISLLARTRYHRDAPLYLLSPGKPLEVEYAHLSEPAHIIRMLEVHVRCATWGPATYVVLTLSKHMGTWKVYGPFRIYYGEHYPVQSLARRVADGKEIYSLNITRPDAARPQEYRIRSRAH